MVARSRTRWSAPPPRTFARRRGAAALAVALLAARAFVACGDEQLPPPRPRSVDTTTGAGGGDASGPPTEPAADAGPPPRNLCECVAAYGGADGPCADCFNAQTADGAQCSAQRAVCARDPACSGISVCLKQCGADLDCQRGCVFPSDVGEAHAAYREVLACVCAACGGTCAYGEPLDCDDVDAGADGAQGGGDAGR